MTIGRWPEWSVTAARERAKELRRAIDDGQDPLSAREDLREAPRVKDMITRYIAEHLPKLAKHNAGDQTSMLRKMVEPAWGNRLVTEITKSDVAKFLDFVAEGRPRPCKEKPNNRARKLQGHKPTPTLEHDLGVVSIIIGRRLVDVEFLDVVVDGALYCVADGLRPYSPIAREPACGTLHAHAKFAQP
jgi:hypothetical protein